MSAFTVRSSSSYELLLPDLFPVEQSFHRHPATAHLALMSSFIVVVPASYLDMSAIHRSIGGRHAEGDSQENREAAESKSKNVISKLRGMKLSAASDLVEKS